MEYFASNDFLLQFISICIVLSLHLVKAPQPNVPIVARLDINLEPADIGKLYMLNLGVDSDDEELMGMVQANDFKAWQYPDGELAEGKLKMWQVTKDKIKRQLGRIFHVAVVEVVYQGHNDHALCFPLVILPEVFEIVKQDKKNVIKMSIAQTETKLPNTPYSGLEYVFEKILLTFCSYLFSRFINTHIRGDKMNQLLLRTIMTKDEKEVAKAACNPDPSDNYTVKLMKAKMKREVQYGGKQPETYRIGNM